jgi:hypothetical protein
VNDARCLDINIDYGTAAGYFIRLDVELPADALYEAQRDDGGPRGWLGVSPDEADALALRLTKMASEVRALRPR